MRKYFYTLLLSVVLLSPSVSWAAIDYCFDFRQSSSYVTDPSGCSPVLDEAYPHTYSNGATAGWTSASVDGTRDRSTAVDPRLAGQNRSGSTDVPPSRDFRVDLPSTGDYDIRTALGDASFGFASNGVNPFALIKDTSTTLFTIVSGDTSILANEWYDATGVKRTSSADWVTNNAAKALTFSTTILNYNISAPNSGQYTPLAHLRVTTGTGGPPPPPPPAGNYYSTSFPANENPINEIGLTWLNGLVDGLDWLNIRSSGGVAFGTRTPADTGDAVDPTAILRDLGGVPWGQNQTAQATFVTFGGPLAAKEVELRLNSTMVPHSSAGYEILYEVSGTVAIVRWNGPLANYTFLAPVTNIPGRAGIGGLMTGDILKATNVNGLISAYLNDVLLLQVTDTTFTGGAPGFGLNTYGTALNSEYGLSDFTAFSAGSTGGGGGGAPPTSLMLLLGMQ